MALVRATAVAAHPPDLVVTHMTQDGLSRIDKFFVDRDQTDARVARACVSSSMLAFKRGACSCGLVWA